MIGKYHVWQHFQSNPPNVGKTFPNPFPLELSSMKSRVPLIQAHNSLRP